MIRRLAVPVLILGTIGAATAATSAQNRPNPAMAKIERSLNGLTPGAPLTCIRRDNINQIQTAEGVILYIGGKHRMYRNAVSGHCSGLKRGDVVVSGSTDARSYCRGDLVQTRAPTGGAYTGSCALGDFIPYTK